MVLITIAILTILSIELHYTVSIDRRLSRNVTDGLRAFYLAKSAVRFSLWRLNFYMAAQNANSGNSSFVPQKYVDMIWSFPIPPLPFDVKQLGLEGAEASGIRDFAAKTSTVGQFVGSIQAEGSKLSINLLSGDEAWNSNKEVQAVQKEVLTQLMQQEYIDNESFQEKFPDFDAEKLVDAIIDYIDVDEVAQKDSSDENDYYSSLDPPMKSKNMPLYTPDELHMIRYWNGEFYDRFAKHFSVFPSEFYINVTTVDKKMLRALAPNVDEVALDEFLKSRSETPFKTAEEFESRFKSLPGVDKEFNKNGQYRFTINERTFIISATGLSGDLTSKQIAGVRLDSLPRDPVTCQQNESQEECDKRKKQLPPLNHLRVVYWKEVQQ